MVSGYFCVISVGDSMDWDFSSDQCSVYEVPPESTATFPDWLYCACLTLWNESVQRIVRLALGRNYWYLIHNQCYCFYTFFYNDTSKAMAIAMLERISVSVSRRLFCI